MVAMTINIIVPPAAHTAGLAVGSAVEEERRVMISVRAAGLLQLVAGDAVFTVAVEPCVEEGNSIVC